MYDTQTCDYDKFIAPAKAPFCQTLSCNNPNAISQTADQATRRSRKLFFAAETFSDRLAYWRAHERGMSSNEASTKIEWLLPHISYIRIRDPNYAAVIMVITVRVSHRLLIPVYSAGISPVFMAANGALLVRPLYRCCYCCCCIELQRFEDGRAY